MSLLSTSVIPAQAGIQSSRHPVAWLLDTRLSGNDVVGGKAVLTVLVGDMEGKSDG